MTRRRRSSAAGKLPPMRVPPKDSPGTLTTIPRFLLKYTSRDEVGLLARGTGGIVEIRNAIAHYEEPSPLFGFLRYRRRNVIIKYMPEDCSRLVQGGCIPSCLHGSWRGQI
jgi:hypothetical protein